MYKRGEARPLEVFQYEHILSFGAPLANTYKIVVDERELLFETTEVRGKVKVAFHVYLCAGLWPWMILSVTWKHLMWWSHLTAAGQTPKTPQISFMLEDLVSWYQQILPVELKKRQGNDRAVHEQKEKCP